MKLFLALVFLPQNCNALSLSRKPSLFCTNHWPSFSQEGNPSCCARCAQPANNTPHFLFNHVEKTGGSSLECAWLKAAREGLVTMLGHGNSTFYEACASTCKANHVVTRRLITVREPYSYWQSLYKYAWQCIFGACESAESQLLICDSDSSGVKVWPLDEQQQGVLRSFADYVKYMHSNQLRLAKGENECFKEPARQLPEDTWWRQSQSERIQLKCGSPCRLDDFEVLHTENLTAEYEALLRKFPGLPQVPLAYENEASHFDGHPWGEPPPGKYTPEVLELVQQMDDWIFNEFSYTREYDL